MTVGFGWEVGSAFPQPPSLPSPLWLLPGGKTQVLLLAELVGQGPLDQGSCLGGELWGGGLQDSLLLGRRFQ